MVQAGGFGRLLREWRARRGLSQLDLAVEAGVSSRHLSFVETGRATPSREMVVLLARALDVPFRDRNDLLTAAGYAAIYRATSLDAPALAQARRALDFILRQQEPYPALVLDRHWNVLKVNEGSARVQALFLDAAAVATLGPDRELGAHGGLAHPVAAPGRGHRLRGRRDARAARGAAVLSGHAAAVARARPGRLARSLPADRVSQGRSRVAIFHDPDHSRHAARHHAPGAARRELLPRRRIDHG